MIPVYCRAPTIRPRRYEGERCNRWLTSVSWLPVVRIIAHEYQASPGCKVLARCKCGALHEILGHEKVDTQQVAV